MANRTMKRKQKKPTAMAAVTVVDLVGHSAQFTPQACTRWLAQGRVTLGPIGHRVSTDVTVFGADERTAVVRALHALAAALK